MKPIEIKVKGCDTCPFWSIGECDSICVHPNNMYDGHKEGEFIEHCPLKERDTVIKFAKE